jgi:hypothetical protein
MTCWTCIAIKRSRVRSGPGRSKPTQMPHLPRSRPPSLLKTECSTRIRLCMCQLRRSCPVPLRPRTRSIASLVRARTTTTMPMDLEPASLWMGLLELQSMRRNTKEAGYAGGILPCDGRRPPLGQCLHAIIILGREQSSGMNRYRYTVPGELPVKERICASLYGMG